MNTAINTIKEKFETLKHYLVSKESHLVKKYFGILGYKYTSSILNNNFFHFAAEALLLNLCKDFSAEVLESEFMDNLSLLIGKSEDRTVGTSFFSNFVQLKAELVKNSSNVTKENFLNVVRQVVNMSINELTHDKKLLLHSTYVELEKSSEEISSNSTSDTKVNNQRPSLDKFISAYISKFSEEERQLKNYKLSIVNPCELYYYFATTTVEELLNDINNFTLQSGSVIYLVIAFIKSQIQEKSIYASNKYNSVNSLVRSKIDTTTKDLKIRRELLNKWVSDSVTSGLEATKIRFPNLYESIETKYVPMFNQYMTYFVDLVETNRKKIQEIRENIVEKVSKAYEVSYETANKYVTIVKENDRVKIIISNFAASKEQLVNLVGEINLYISQANSQKVKEDALQLYTDVKSKVISQYRKFLGVQEEKEVEIELSETVDK